MGSDLTTFFSFSILALVIGGVDASILTLKGWQVASLIGSALAFSRMKGKSVFSSLSLVFTLQLAFQAWQGITQTITPLLGMANLLLFLMLSQIPEFSGKSLFFRTLVLVFWAVGLCGCLFIPTQGDASIKGRMIFFCFMGVLATGFLIPARFGAMEKDLGFPVVLLLLGLWFTKEPLITIGFLAGILTRKHFSSRWAWLSLLFIPLLSISRFFALPFGFLLTFMESGNLYTQETLCVPAVFTGSVWVLAPLAAFGILSGKKREKQAGDDAVST